MMIDVVIALTILGFLFTAFGWILSRISSGDRALHDRVDAVESQVKAVEAKAVNREDFLALGDRIERALSRLNDRIDRVLERSDRPSKE